MLADAGYPGGKGFGKLILNTSPSTAMPFVVESAQLAAELWRRELGLDVELGLGDNTGLKGKERSRELDGQIWWRDANTRKDSSSLGVARYGDLKSASRMHENPELFRLVQDTYKILDPDKQEETLKKLFLRLKDEDYQISVGYVNIPWAVGPRVNTWHPNPLALYVSALHTITLK